MKFLLFSDVHQNKRHCQKLVEMAQEVDMVIGAGDFGSFHVGVKGTVQLLSAIDKPSIVVPGNAETYEELQEACEAWPQAHVLHGNGVKIDGIDFYGIGGGIPVTPFGDWSYDFTEEEASELLRDCPEGAVLVSHSPPHGILDLSSRGERLGSTTIRATMELKKLQLVVCGHIHESGGLLEKVGDTDVVNAGPRGIIYTWRH